MTDSTGPSNPHELAFYVWATSQGWQVTKQGWPDFICRRGDERMAVEVKGGNDGVSSYQWATLTDLRRAGMPTFVWTPYTGLQEDGLPSIAESIVSLQAENARLRSLLAAANKRAASDLPSTPSLQVGIVSHGRWADEESLVLLNAGEGCEARHKPGHWAPKSAKRMRLCAWLLKVDGQIEVAVISEITGLAVPVLERLTAGLKAERDKYLKHLYRDFPKRPKVRTYPKRAITLAP